MATTTNGRRTGVWKFYDDRRRLGMIKRDGDRDLYVPEIELLLEHGEPMFEPGDRVSFAIGGPSNRQYAKSLMRAR
jgi:cold shock CspA family protein